MPFRNSFVCHDLVTIRKSALRPSLGCACSGARKTASQAQTQTKPIEYQRARRAEGGSEFPPLGVELRARLPTAAA
jgi:hypothetical protein